MPCVAREVTSTHIAPEQASDYHGGSRGCGRRRPWLACLFGVVVSSVTGFSQSRLYKSQKPNKKGRKYDAVYDLCARNTIKAPQFFGRGVRVPTISLVDIRHQSYFQVKAMALAGT